MLPRRALNRPLAPETQHLHENQLDAVETDLPEPQWRSEAVKLCQALPRLVFCSYNQQVATWDEQKRQANLSSHGLDFKGCEAVFDHPVVTREDSRMAYGEQRINLLGWLRDRVVHLTYTERGEDLHVISLREATKHETRYYFKVIAHEA